MLAHESLGMQRMPLGFLFRSIVLVSLASVAGAQTLTMPGEHAGGSGSVLATEGASLSPMNASPVVNDSYTLETGGVGSVQSSGAYYNPTLGSHIRARYNTRSYGQEDGFLDLGTMKLFDMENGVAFFDGQVTLNDESNVGYNLGLGYRWFTLPLLPYSPDREKIMGISVWADGQGVGAENHFNQIGTSLEFLGDKIDFRANGYAPVGPRSRVRDLRPTSLGGDISFTGNNIAQSLIGVRDTALTVGEAELAGRLGDLDAWVFGGVYGFSGGEFDAVGGKVGLRGYATPDLALSIALTNDDEFDTNAVFSLTWFIGRTRAENCPTGTLADRLREPVIRNDYIATQQTTIESTGNIVLDPDGDALRIVHVDSTAAAGGDGTFENPLNSLTDINSNSMDDDVVLAHGGSTFSGQTATLRDGQSFFGEGDSFDIVLATDNGTITLPETAPGAAAGARPMIGGAGVTGVILADANLVENLSFDGLTTAISSGAYPMGAGDPTLRNLSIANTTGNAIELASFRRTDVDDVDNDGDTTEESIEFNVVLDQIDLNNIGGASGILINANENDDSDNPDIPLNESIAVSNLSVTGGAGVGLTINNAEDTTAVAINNYDYDGGVSGLGALQLNNVGVGNSATNSSTVTITNSTFTGGDTGAAAAAGIAIRDSGAAVTIDGTNSFTNIAGTTILIDGDGGAGIEEGNVTVGANIANNDGRAVIIQDIDNGATFNFTGDITETVGGEGIQVTNNSAGTVIFGGEVDITSSSASAVVDLVNNSGATIDFNGGLDIATTGAGVAFNATGGGSIGTPASTNNTISSTGSTALNLDGVDIGSGGLTFDTVDASGGANGIVLNDVTGGTVQIGATNADSTVANEVSTITGVTGDGVSITNAANVEINGLLVEEPAAGQTGIVINGGTMDDSTVTINNSRVTTSSPGTAAPGDGVLVSGGGTGVFDVNLNNVDVSEVQDGFVLTNLSSTADVDAVDSTALDVTGDGVRSSGSASGSDVSFTTTTATTGAAYRADGFAINVNGGSGTHNFEGDITNTTGDAVQVTGNDGAVTISGDITNTSTGRLATITSNTGGNINFSGVLMDGELGVSTGGTGLLVQNNTGGTVNFTNSVLINASATSSGVSLVSNSGTDINFLFDPNERLEIATTNAIGLQATGGGELSITGGDNIINSTGGIGLLINDITIDADNVAFESISSSGAANGVSITDTTGGSITIGDGGGSDGDGGTLNATGSAIVLSDAGNVTFNDVAITGAAGAAVDIDSTDVNTSSVTFNNLQTPATANAITADQTGTGNLSVTIADSELNATTGDAVTFTGVDGAVFVNNTEINNGAMDGVTITNSDGVFNFDNNTTINNAAGVAITVDGGESNVTFNGTITNTVDRSVVVQNKTAGGVSFGSGSTITDTGAGIFADNNSGGNYNFLGDNDLTTTTNTAVELTNNSGSTFTFSDLAITTTSGDGFSATGGGTVSVTGTTNTITTDTGVGLVINDTDVGGAGVAFDSVTVANSGTNGINLSNSTGGTVTIGDAASSTDGDGGSITSTGSAVVATNIAGLTMNNVTIASSGSPTLDIESNNATNMSVSLNNVDDAAQTGATVVLDHTGSGNVNFVYSDSIAGGSIVMNHSGAGTFDFLSTSLTVNANLAMNATGGGGLDFFTTDLVVNTGADVDAVNIDLSGNLTDADISIAGASTSLTTQDGSALAIASSGSPRQVRFELSSATLSNNSATSNNFDLQNGGITTLAATISSNSFTNANGSLDFDLTNDAASTTNLSLVGNNSASANGLALTNNNAAANFNILGVDSASVDAANNNDVDYVGGDANFTFNSGLIVTPPSN